IRLRGENPLVVDVNTPLNDPWVDASDNYYPSVIVTTSGSVLTGELGEYPITYTATDGAGNQSSVTRLVRVVDRIAPQISILGPNPIEHIRFTPYTEDLNNVRITDNYYLEDTLKKPGYLRIDYSKFDPSRPGLQIITLRVTDPSGNRSIEETRFVRVVEFTSLNEFGENGKFRLFPNPTKDRVTITANTNIGIETYTVLDVLGRIVLQANPTDSTQTTIDLGQLQNGIYMVVLRDKEGKEATQKVVKE
ncbi:MAG: DUF5011 domain-containing protein, partial [Bacteroidia bacterium]|nr:DUF5011 domain-containing protein [Bacteroidia bacterium]